MCTFGLAPSTYQVLQTNPVKADNQYAANIMDFIPNTSIMPFGTCNSPTNPQVAVAPPRRQVFVLIVQSGP
jgi:hypothetical protein